MRQIADNVWHFDNLGYVNAYLWRWDGGLALIDTGLPWTVKRVLAGIREAGFRPEDVTEILVTHADADHAGGLKALREATGARVIVHAIEAMFFKGKWRRLPNWRHPAGAALFPLYLILNKTLMRIPQLNPDLLVIDEEVLDNGLQVIHTPGHTPGHMSLYSRDAGVLFVGDVIDNRKGEPALPLPIFTPQMDVVKDSIRKLARLKNVEIACFGHGPVITEKAGERIRALAARVAPPRKRRAGPRKVQQREGIPRQPKAKTPETPKAPIRLEEK